MTCSADYYIVTCSQRRLVGAANVYKSTFSRIFSYFMIHLFAGEGVGGPSSNEGERHCGTLSTVCVLYSK